MAGYVYLIGSSTYGWYKIGKSSTPEIRVKDLGILLPFRIGVFAVWKAENHHLLEATLHEKYAKFRINGEWFHFDIGQLEQVIRSVPEEARISVLEGFTNVKSEDWKLRQRLQRIPKESKNEPKKEIARDQCSVCGRWGKSKS